MICCCITEDKKDKAISSMLRVRSRADLVEIRLDYIKELDNSSVKELLAKKRHPLIMTCRKPEEGGLFNGSEEKRIGFLKESIDNKADYIDIEYSSGKEVISDLIKHKKDTKIIVSYHNFKELPENIEEIYNDMNSTGCDIIKIACMATSLNDNLRIFDLIRKARKDKKEIIALCMGEKGEVSRVLNLAHGSHITYGYLHKGKESAPGQISCEFLKRVYRVDKLNPDTQIYGLVGNPVSKSRGFIVHNLAFKEKEINAVYLNFLVDDLKEFIANFRNIISGFSITMPFKKEIISHLDNIDYTAKKIGAVNTVVKENNKLIGYNTDLYGAISSIEEKSMISNKKVVLIGAGGAARAIGYGIIQNKGILTITNRTEEKGRKLAKELGADFKLVQEIDWKHVDILVNSTSVGMAPNINKSPLERKNLHNMVVFDVVYSPPITKLLSEAERNGCTVISGIKMFAYQAEKQFELWTKEKIEVDFMERSALEYVAG